MRHSNTWKKVGNEWHVYLYASDKQNLAFWFEPEGESVDLVDAEIIGWHTLLNIMCDKLPKRGSVGREILVQDPLGPG